MQQTNSIELKPIMEPTPVAFTFDTVGWKILFMLIVVMAIFIAYNLYKKYKKSQYRRDAISTILKINLNNEIELSNFIKQIMFQLKQTALETFGRSKVASLEGDNWLQFLKETGKNTDFTSYKEEIFSSIYKDKTVLKDRFNKKEFTELSIKWINSHA